MKRLPVAVLAILALLSSGAALGAQATWEQGRRALQQGAGGTFERNGYRLTGDPRTGTLANADSIELTLELRTGVEYKLVGACDPNCTDLNLALYDAGGNQVDLDDIPEDNAPIVTVAPRQAGVYKLRVQMAACSRAPCRFAVGTYGK